MATSSGFGVKGGEGRIGGERSTDDKLCDCPGCTARRLHILHEIEQGMAARGQLPPLPDQNAPSTFTIQ